MKLTLTQENLSKGLNIVSHTAAKNVTLPILNNILIRTEAKAIKLMATNLEIGITCIIRGKIEKEGAFTVNARLFNDFVSLLPRDKVELELKDTTLEVIGRDNKTSIKGLPAEDFPLIPQISRKNGYKIKASVFRKALSRVIYAAASDATRPEISGVYFIFEDNTLTLTATDSYRLAESKIALENKAGQKKDMIVPTRTLQEVMRITDEEMETLEIFVSENQILFCFDEIELVSRLIEGQYPDYQQIIPSEYKTKIIANVQELIKRVKTTSLFCKPGINDVSLEFDPAGKKIIVSAANTQIGENVSTLEAEVEGEKNNIVFNYRFLLDGLMNIDGEDVIIEMTNNTSPGAFKSKEGDRFIYIIMPIRQ